MSIFIEKAVQNQRAANILLQDSYKCYVSSVHCAYYGVFQLMAHILRHEVGSGNYNYWNEWGAKGSHEQTIGKIFDAIQQRDKKQATHFKRMIEVLKNNRVTADYKEKEVTIEFSSFAVEQSEKLHSLLRTTFNI
ncbi:MAG: hypothetical protein EAY79_11475 [Runella slithyformis]|nr:MAG: hypothetical protein EAY79_11475 [Runella slithyformis]